jgi:uncharacterized membrane protein YccC
MPPVHCVYPRVATTVASIGNACMGRPGMHVEAPRSIDTARGQVCLEHDGLLTLHEKCIRGGSKRGAADAPIPEMLRPFRRLARRLEGNLQKRTDQTKSRRKGVGDAHLLREKRASQCRDPSPAATSRRLVIQVPIARGLRWG